MNTETLGNKLSHYADLKAKKKILAEEVSQLGSEIEAQEREIIADMCNMAEASDLDLAGFSVTINGRRYGVIRKPYFSIKAEDRLAAFNALRRLGLGDLITESVDARTLTKTIIELTEQAGGVLPEQYAAIPMQQYDKDTISDRKVSK